MTAPQQRAMLSRPPPALQSFEAHFKLAELREARFALVDKPGLAGPLRGALGRCAELAEAGKTGGRPGHYQSVRRSPARRPATATHARPLPPPHPSAPQSCAWSTRAGPWRCPSCCTSRATRRRARGTG